MLNLLVIKYVVSKLPRSKNLFEVRSVMLFDWLDEVVLIDVGMNVLILVGVAYVGIRWKCGGLERFWMNVRAYGGSDILYTLMMVCMMQYSFFIQINGYSDICFY